MRDRCKLFMWLPLLALAGCAAGPDYVRPAVETPAEFKQAAGWKPAEPRELEVRGKWWEIFGDPVLNSLQEQVEVSNQSLAQAEARFRQARGLLQASRAGLFPSLGGGVSATRSGGERSTQGAGTRYNLALDANWETDLWGRVRRSVESSQAGAQASAADVEATRLSLHAQLAQTYFQLRTAEEQHRLYERTVADYQRSLQVTENQYAAGVAARANVVLAQTQLKSAQAQSLELGLQRAQAEHALAILVGKPPAQFSLASAPLPAAVPAIPAGVPSTLLERRPDIAGAERRMAAANAQIGVAQAAFFPNLTLSAGLGFQSSSLADWLSAPSRFWSLGPALAQSLFDAGARRAQAEQAGASYDASVAAYRQTVLDGFREVEDSLAALRILEQEAQVLDEAVQAARLSVTLANNQYQAGVVTYLSVINAQTTALANERNAVELLNRRLSACVQLIKALGGGWDAARLPALNRGD